MESHQVELWGTCFPEMGSAESDVVMEVIYARVKRNEFPDGGIEIIFDSPKYLFIKITLD
jgi:hypothetical protein